MRLKSLVLKAALAFALLGMSGLGIWIASLPATPAGIEPPAIDARETAAMLEALRPTRRARPLIAVVGINDATETTDYLMPAGILRRADVAEVALLATAEGPVKLYPALTVQPDRTIASFDARYPEGADYVLVPAMSRDDDPIVMSWLRGQAAKGAMVIGVCAGAKVVGAAGLLEGKRATTHWYYLKELLRKTPSIVYVPNRRMVVDGRVATTTGISASMPMALTLVEAIAGRDKAVQVALDLGVGNWDQRHASDAFKLNRSFAFTVLKNSGAFWARDVLGLRLEPNMDEVSLALVADAWSRTYRSRVETRANRPDAFVTRHGIVVIPDEVAASISRGDQIPTFSDQPSSAALDATLSAISVRYGRPTGEVVAMQLEYPMKRVER